MLLTVEEQKPFFTKQRKIFILKISVLVILLVIAGYFLYDRTLVKPIGIVNNSSSVVNVPTVPKIEKPLPVQLPFPKNVCNDGVSLVSTSVDNARFIDCIVSISTPTEITISNAEFIRSILVIQHRDLITLKDVVFSDLKNDSPANKQRSEETRGVIIANDCQKLMVNHVDFLGNELPVRISGCEAVEISDSTFQQNLLNSAVMLSNNKSVKIHNNNFAENYPSALEISSALENPSEVLDIYRNTFTNNFGDQIHFKNYRNNQLVRVFNNVVLGGRSAQVLIENSSPANISLISNYLGKSVKCTDVNITFPNNYTGWCFGKPNGVVVNSSTDITLSGNVVVQNENSGIVLMRAKNVTIKDNIIAKNSFFGIFASESSDVQLSNNKFLENKEDLNPNATVTLVSTDKKK